MSEKKEKEIREENYQEKISFWSFLWVKYLGFRRRLKSEPFRKIKSDCCTFDLNQKEAKKAGTTNIIEKVCWGRYSWYWMRARYSATVWERPAEIYATWYRATCYVLSATVQRIRYVLQCKGYAKCYSAKDTLSATVQRIRYVRRLSPAYDSCSRSRRGEKSCLWARWRGKQDQMGETIAQAKRQVGVKGSSKKIVKFRT